jgi:hypothetical protein
MSNAIIKSIEQLQNAQARQKEIDAENYTHNMNVFKENLIRIFSKDIVESFDILEITPVERQYYSYKAILIYDGTPIELYLQNVGLMQPGPMQATLRVGSETLKHFQVALPTEKMISRMLNDRYNVSGLNETPEMMLIKIQQENDAKLISCLNESITKRIAEIKADKPGWWLNNIPYNYSGASRVESLLKNLEIDRIFLEDEIYEKIRGILNGVLIDAKIKEKEEAELKIKNKVIVKQAKEEYEAAYKQYEINLTELCKFLAKQYFKPWVLYTTCYFPEHFDVRDIRDEDGEILDDLADAVTEATSYIGEPDKDGFLTCVNNYGNTFKRKISTNIYHIDKVEYNTCIEVTATSVPFWKRYTPDPKCNGIGFVVPPGTEVTINECPIRPLEWDKKCQELGIKEPWRWL